LPPIAAGQLAALTEDARAPNPPRESVAVAGDAEKAAGITLARVPFAITL
jgi:hypothetical protein